MDDFLPNINGQVNLSGGIGMVRQNQVGSRVVAFYTRSVHNPLKSAEAGSQVFDDHTYFKSFQPGEQRFEVVDRPASRQDQQLYPMQWQAYQQNREHRPDGTPIEQLYPEKPSIGETLKANGVYTIQQAAALEGNAVDNIGMGGQGWVNDARRYLEVAEKGVSITKYRKELDDRDGKIRVLENQVQQLLTQVTHLQQNAGAVDPAVVQQVMAQLQGGGNRPIMPANPRSKAFDAQTAQINATHATADIARQKKNRRKAGAS